MRALLDRNAGYRSRVALEGDERPQHSCVVAPFARSVAPPLIGVFLAWESLTGTPHFSWMTSVYWRVPFATVALLGGLVLFRRPKRAWLAGDTLVARTGPKEVRLPLASVTGLRFDSSPWDTGTVILQGGSTEIDLQGVGWNTRGLRFEVGRRLRAHGTVPTSWDRRWAWRRLGVKVERHQAQHRAGRKGL